MTFDELFSPQFPMLVNSALACLIGLEESIFVMQLHYWQLKYSSDPRHQFDGKKWVWNSANDWRQQFPFWSPNKIGRICRKLEADGLIESACLNAHKYDRTKWYCINREAFKSLLSCSQQADFRQSSKMENENLKVEDLNLQDCTNDSSVLGDRYHRKPQTSSKTNHNKSDVVGLDLVLEQIPVDQQSDRLISAVTRLLITGKPPEYLLQRIQFAFRKASNGGVWGYFIESLEALLGGKNWHSVEEETVLKEVKMATAKAERERQKEEQAEKLVQEGQKIKLLAQQSFLAMSEEERNNVRRIALEKCLEVGDPSPSESLLMALVTDVMIQSMGLAG